MHIDINIARKTHAKIKQKLFVVEKAQEMNMIERKQSLCLKRKKLEENKNNRKRK